MNPLRSIGGVLGGLGVISLIVQAMEFSLVMAMAGGRIGNMAQYLAIANQPVILAAKLVYYPVAGLLGGYVAARVAMRSRSGSRRPDSQPWTVGTSTDATPPPPRAANAVVGSGTARARTPTERPKIGRAHV